MTKHASEILSQNNISFDEETLFNIFQGSILSWAYAASTQPKLRKFAKIKKGLFGKQYYFC
jgi:hypothetical protein